MSEYLKTEIEKHHHQALSEGEGVSSRAEMADLAQRVHELESAMSLPDATPPDASLVSRFERQSASADRTIAVKCCMRSLSSCARFSFWITFSNDLSLIFQSLAARVEALESTIAPPLKALTEKLADLEIAMASHSLLGALDSSDLRNALNVVKALALQVFTHCPACVLCSSET